ncbi:MAG: porin [Gammaproteobacteria bacterium]|nr:porin [Gammaproteobacteria bacterium]
MNYSCHSFRRKLLVTAVSLVIPVTVNAESSNADLQQQLDALQNQVTALNSEVQQAAEWKNPNTLVHMAGYADVGFISTENANDSFVAGTFAPILHYQYRDAVMMEAELEFEVGEDGGTEVALEYMTIDWFMSDYAVLVAGKFLSPVGQFRQNLHPSWINKLASAPPGFGHDGAAPVSDLGFQLRGGFPLGNMRANYAVYASNGPEINSEAESDDATGVVGYELDGVAAEGFGADVDGEKTWGGRIGILPIASVEIGLSLATGMATVTNVEGNEQLFNDKIVGPLSGETARDYDVIGADFVWLTGNMSLRGEYVKTEVGEATTGVTASEAAEWTTWYTQAAYRLPNTKWEGVLRYTDYDSPHASVDQKQTAIGVNYLVSNNFMVKLTHELNDGLDGANSDIDRTLLQLAYGF